MAFFFGVNYVCYFVSSNVSVVIWFAFITGLLMLYSVLQRAKDQLRQLRDPCRFNTPMECTSSVRNSSTSNDIVIMDECKDVFGDGSINLVAFINAVSRRSSSGCVSVLRLLKQADKSILEDILKDHDNAYSDRFINSILFAARTSMTSLIPPSENADLPVWQAVVDILKLSFTCSASSYKSWRKGLINAVTTTGR